jgi:fructose-1-phosphate kinase PfkB-like protein
MVSEVGWKMDPTLKVFLKQSNKMSAGQDKLQEQLQKDRNTGRGKLNTAISAGQEELKKSLKSKINYIKAAQSEFKESITDTLDRQLKDAMAMIKQQAQNLHDEFTSEVRCT